MRKKERGVEGDYLKMMEGVRVLEEETQSYVDTVQEIERLESVGSQAVIRLDFCVAGDCYSLAGGHFLELGGTDNLKHAAENFAIAGRFYSKEAGVRRAHDDKEMSDHFLDAAKRDRVKVRVIRQELGLREAKSSLDGQIALGVSRDAGLGI